MEPGRGTPAHPRHRGGTVYMRSPTAVSLLVLMIVIVLAFSLQLIRA
jgi:hypothetical protein